MPFELSKPIHRNPPVLLRLAMVIPNDLPEAEAVIREELAAARRGELTTAIRVYLARQHHSTAGAWIAWAEERFGLARRTIYEMLAAADLVMRQGIRHPVLLNCSRCVLATLAVASTTALEIFLERHAADLPTLARDQVRALLSSHPDAPPIVRDRAQCADPRQLLLFDPATLEPTREALCLGAYAERVKAVVDKYSDAEFEDLLNGLAETIDELKAARASAQSIRSA